MKIVKSFFACVVLFPGVLMAWEDHPDSENSLDSDSPVPSSANSEEAYQYDESDRDERSECCKGDFIQGYSGSPDKD